MMMARLMPGKHILYLVDLCKQMWLIYRQDYSFVGKILKILLDLLSPLRGCRW